MAAKEKTGGAAALELTDKQKRRKATLKLMRQNYQLYIFLIPAIVFIVLFMYTPLYGLQIAFKNYRGGDGIWGSAWVGLKWFNQFFSTPRCWEIVKNTLTISVYSLVAGFPLPICLAIILNYVKNIRFKKFAQTVTYMPYFISTVVICGMITIFMAPDTGILNVIRGFFGLESVNFLAKPEWFKSIYVWTGVWQGMGWSSIIYISALAGVDYEMHEAAIVDGATKIQRMIHVDLPSIKPTILMLLILQMGSIMNVGFEKVYLLQNTLNKSAASVISTYVYEVGLINSDYGYSTAVGLFNSLINLGLVVAANQLSKRFAGESLF